jgi:tetratricopeptide (TPR) repeat protein
LTLFKNAPILRLRAKLLYSFEGFRTILVLVRRSAEALETQGRWQEAAAEYRNVLAQNPRLPGIHYRLGQLILSQPKTPTTAEDAHREFEEELKINPSNAGAEYVLGELARQADQWPQAIEHFSRASKLDSGFGDAFIGLGRSLITGGRAPEAIPPLETAAKLQPDNPVCHYYPAMAYRRTGRKADADREVAVHKQMSEKARQTAQEVQLGVLGPQRVDPREPDQPDGAPR